jgi:hypothetical protein
MTFGGDLDLDLVGDLGRGKDIMDVGLGFGLLHGVRSVSDRGVTEPAPLRFVRLGELRPSCSLGMSWDFRPATRLLSSATARRSVGAGERWRGVVGAGGEDLFALIMFSKRARRSDTGFCIHCQRLALDQHQLTYNGRAVHALLLCVLHGVLDLLVSRHQGVSYMCSSTMQAIFPLGGDGNGVGVVEGHAAQSHKGRMVGVVELCGDVPVRYGMA